MYTTASSGGNQIQMKIPSVHCAYSHEFITTLKTNDGFLLKSITTYSSLYFKEIQENKFPVPVYLAIVLVVLTDYLTCPVSILQC